VVYFPQVSPTKPCKYLCSLSLIRATSPASLSCLSYNGKLFALKRQLTLTDFLRYDCTVISQWLIKYLVVLTTVNLGSLRWVEKWEFRAGMINDTFFSHERILNDVRHRATAYLMIIHCLSAICFFYLNVKIITEIQNIPRKQSNGNLYTKTHHIYKWNLYC